jgi:16S rRNA (guanine(1405)-N(7))-methyltransferase
VIDSSSIERLTKSVLATAKYAHISTDLVQRLIQREMMNSKKEKEIIQRTRSKLHQVASAFQEKPIPYTKWLSELVNLPQDFSSDEVRHFCTKCMTWHSSTNERLPILAEFYNLLFEKTGPVESILDLACGLNPLAIPWMGLPKSVQYIGNDIYTDQADFINKFFQHMKITGQIEVTDLVSTIPTHEADVAFLLKTISCLEQMDKSIGLRLLDTINAKTIVVSFPVASLGGKDKGMLQNYEAHFWQLISGKSWKAEKLVFPSELVFLLKKS